MKRLYFYYAILALIVVATTALYFYHPEHNHTIPPLKERQGPIATTSEWLNTKAAIQGLQRKLRDNPDDTQSRLLLAMAYMQEGRVTGEHPYYYPAALELVDEVIDSKPEEKEVLYEATVAKASIQLSLHQFEQALVTGHQALQINDKRASVYGVLCDANVELGNYEEAIRMADKMVAIRPDLKSYSRISYLREINGDMPGAIEAMQMASKAGFPGLEQTAWSKVTLGGLYEKTGDLQQAEVIYRQALAENPNYAFALGGLGRIEAKQKNYTQAIEYLTKAAIILPEFSFQEELAHVYKQTGQNQKARVAMKELLAGLQEDEDAGHNVDLELAKIYVELAPDYDKALTYALNEYKRRPDNIDVCKALATIYYKKKDIPRATAFLKRASRTNSQDATLMCLTGLVNLRTGKKTAGQDYIRQSFELDPFQNNTIGREGKRILNQRLSSL